MRASVTGAPHSLVDQPALADASWTEQCEQMTAAFVHDEAECLLEAAQLAFASDERRVEATCVPGGLRVDAQQAECGHPTGLSFESQRFDRLDLDGIAHQPIRLCTDQDLARDRGLLETSRDIDRVAGDECLARVRATGHHLARVDPGAQDDGDAVGTICFGTQLGQPFPDLSRGPDGPQGIVLMQGRDAEDRHHCVADELLDRSPVTFEHLAHDGEVAAQQAAERLGIVGLAQGGGTGDVGEDDRNRLARFARDPCYSQRVCTLRAELGAIGIVDAAAWTRDHGQSVVNLEPPLKSAGSSGAQRPMTLSLGLVPGSLLLLSYSPCDW